MIGVVAALGLLAACAADISGDDEVEITMVPLGRLSPGHLVVAPDGRSSYFASATFSEEDKRVQVLDNARREIVATYTFDTDPDDTWVRGMALSGDGRWLHVITSHRLVVLDTATGATAATVVPPDTVGLGALAVARDGRHVYLFDDQSALLGLPGRIFVVDVGTATVVGQTALKRDLANGALVSPDGTRLYATTSGWSKNRTESQVALETYDITTTTPRFVSDIGLLPPNQGVYHPALNPVLSDDGQRIYAVGSYRDLLVVDPVHERLVATIPVDNGGEHVRAVAVRHDGSAVYVARDQRTAADGPVVAVVDTATARIVDTLVGFEDDYIPALAVAPGDDTLYTASVTDPGTDTRYGAAQIVDLDDQGT
ncbi:WD40 repeat domain-containing protein [Saccharothrix violaceirubra]|uniref:DNA-binding beta-propeller fold protein YncE n=1 Tax=Saccharothrix violaceirubra TaxID=413306 RepID=A0A7W7T4C8_9PSEU|nr:hypothetical protein [Saccharothrix violaceirubra]MBB4966324.1 DNA-binding beta-propeller fold protein YncE [Saccharothrix violaceirubra]